MNFTINIDIKKPDQLISYRNKILLVGSCFTEHIGNALEDLKFSVLQNPNGILFDPASVCKSLQSYITNYQYADDELFQLNEVWNSWNHHSRFSHIDKIECLKKINVSQQKAHTFLKDADWMIITLGSSFIYKLSREATKALGVSQKPPLGGLEVSNCHRAPAQWFNKNLPGIDEIVSILENTCHQLKQFNPKLKFIFTISPVRHIRDGVVENNRSKARLIEAVHHITGKFDNTYYFPAYELVIDVLRDYRFYDIDLVHPNYAATEFVMEKFKENFIDEDSQAIMEEVKKLVIARKHKPFQPETTAHQSFLKAQLEKTKELQVNYPFLNLDEEINYFASA